SAEARSRLDRKAREPFLHRLAIPTRIDLRAEARDPRDRHLRWRIRLLRDDADAFHQLRAAVPHILAEHRHAALRGSLLTDETTNQRRLSGAVAPEQRIDRSARYVQRDVVDGDVASVTNGQGIDRHDIRV